MIWWYVVLSDVMRSSLTVSEINCVGQKGETTIAGLPSHIISKTGLFKVKDTLQIMDEDLSNVFAVGDVADTNAIKQGRAAAIQAMIAADNIVKLIKGQRLRPYRPGLIEHMIDISMGVVCSFLHIDGFH